MHTEMNAIAMNAVEEKVNELVEAVRERSGALAFGEGEAAAVRQVISDALATGCTDEDAVFLAVTQLG